MTLVLIGKGLVLGGLTFKNRGHLGSRYIPSLKLTFSHLKMDGWNTFSFPFGSWPIFRGELAVSFTECNYRL